MAKNLDDSYSKYALSLVCKICSEVGPGAPGTPQEKARAAILKQEMESLLGTNNVSVEEFTVTPGAFLGWLRWAAGFALVSSILNMTVGRCEGIAPWITSLLALMFSLGAVMPGIFEFMLYFEFTEPFFRKKTSQNIIGRLTKPGTKEIKQVLILGGHHDSALEMNMLRYLGYGYYVAVATLFIGFLTLMMCNLLQLIGALSGNEGLLQRGTLGWISMAYPVLPSIIFAALFVGNDKNGGAVPGACDNLSASALALAMCKFLVKNPECIPDNTEVRFISFGSEEAGLRGSRKYVERHMEELKRLDARLLNFETVAHPTISILTSDVNGFIKNSPEMVESVRKAAERAGVPFKVIPFPFGGGGTDSGSFSREGLKAVTLLPFKVPQQMVAFYHQRWDRPEVLSEEPMMNVLKVALEWITARDE